MIISKENLEWDILLKSQKIMDEHREEQFKTCAHPDQMYN